MSNLHFNITQSQPPSDFFNVIPNNNIKVNDKNIRFDLATFGIFNRKDLIQPLIINRLVAENIVDSKIGRAHV